jgi:caffeoyl-CoA O-methyltransferase
MKYISLNDELAAYLGQSHSQVGDDLLMQLQKRTLELGDIHGMQISPEQGTLLSLLSALCNAKIAVEVGTFTGYSALCIVRSLAPGGKLHCFDMSDEWTRIGREFWQKAGVENKIELHLGDAHQTLANWSAPGEVDFAFVDADKSGYDFYFETLLPRMRRGALMIFDNTLRDGHAAKPREDNDDDQAIHALNAKLARDPRVQTVLLPLADGVTLCRVV